LAVRQELINLKHFRRVSLQATSLPEVRVLGDDGQTMPGGIVPDDRIDRPSQPNFPDVDGVRESIGKSPA
jgi:hypothetical protein